MTHILIVEDSKTQAHRLLAILEDKGYSADIAEDAEKGLALLEKASYDMVVTDIVMPGMSGYKLCKIIKDRSDLKDIPVILLTTRKDPKDIILGLESGADSFFTKPYQAQPLVERIQSILYNRKLRSQSKLQVGIEISLFGRVIAINSEKEQILDLLVNTFEDIIQTNQDLEKSKRELAAAQVTIGEYVKLLEQRVDTSEARYSNIVENLADGLVTFDETGVVDMLNPAAEEILGYTKAELIGQKITQLFAAADTGEAPDLDTIAVHGSHEFVGQHKNGRRFPMMFDISGNTEGKKQTYIGLFRDLSEGKAMEQRLRQVEKMEAIGQLTGGVAHDFNNLLTVILGNIEFLQEQLAGTPKLLALAKMVESAAQRGADLTRYMLAFARNQTLEPRITDPGRLVSGMLELLQRTLRENIEIKVIRCEENWQMLVDPAQLENAVLNLSLNARDAMPQGGNLTIEIDNVSLDTGYARQNDEVHPGDYVMIAVSDSGLGMLPEQIQHAFEPFFTTKAKGQGTGLGLSMVYGFIKQSRGHVKIYSELGQGTTVKMYIPRSMDPEESSLERGDSDVRGGSESILLVEDDELVRQFAELQLTNLGYQVFVTKNGPEALEMIKVHPNIDLLFTDVILQGGMNGPEVAERAADLHAGIKVLFTSGYTDNALIQNGRLASGAHLLDKPYRRAELARKVRDVLDEVRTV